MSRSGAHVIQDPPGADQDLLVRSGSTWAALAVGSTTGQQLVVRSDGTVKWTNPPVISAKAWGIAVDGSDQTTLIQQALDAAAGAELHLPHGTYGYTSLTFNNVARVSGDGPERTIFKPLAAASSPTITADFASFSANLELMGLSWDMANCPTNDAVYINNVNKLYVHDCKFREGRRQLWLGYVAGSKISSTWHMNFKSAGVYVAPPNPATSTNLTGQQPNVEFDTVHGESTSVNNGVAADALIWINGFCSGLSFENIWAIKSIASNTGTWGAGIRIDGPEAPSYSNGLGHFALMSNVNTDGIDGPGLKLTNVRQVQYTNSFLGTRSAANSGTDAGIHLFGTCLDIISGGGSWISGQGIVVDVAATVNGFQSNNDTFPQTVTGGAFVVPSGATLSNWSVGPGNRYFTAQFPDDATAGRVLLAAPSTTTRPAMQPPKILVSAANTYERIEEHNPVAGQSWYRDVTDTGAAWRVLDNAQRVIFQLANGGGATIGNASGTTNTPATIKKITSQSTAYAGNATLAAGARDSITVTIANASMATNDGVFVNSSVALPQGVSLKAVVATATTLTVYIENNGASSANVGACNIRTTVFQYASA